MIDAGRLLESLSRRRVTLATGVPCSFLSPLIDSVISDPITRYVGATNEGEATAIAAGTWLAGGSGVVLCQNSGLGNMVNPLTSLAYPSRIPMLVLCTWRGQPGLKDEPQHELMGRVMPDLLRVIDVGAHRLPKEEDELEARLDEAWDAMELTQLPFCLIVEKGAVAPTGELRESAAVPAPRGEIFRLGQARRASRYEVLERMVDCLPEHAAVIATTGKTGRELFTVADREQHFYLVGAMGCASAVGLGVATQTDRPVVVVDGDGAALMKLGNLATIGVQAPSNLVHVLLDNGVHDSTGGQRTVATAIDFGEIAIACGYRRVVHCDSLRDFEAALRLGLSDPGPQLIRMCIRAGSLAELGRPTVHPSEVARRFRDFATDPLYVPEPVAA